MKDALLFLNGDYSSTDLDYYKRLCPGKLTVAVDAGYNFFMKTGLVPDVLIGDFDSLEKVPEDLPSQTDIQRFPSDKDQTDAELALRYCFDRKITQIDLIQPSYGEPDQFMGNLMLLTLTNRLVGGYNPQLRILNPRYEIVFLDNVRKNIDNAVGDTVSILPLSQEVKYTCRGTAYDVREFTVELGFSVGLRNRITASSAVFDITGQAFLIRVYAGAYDQKGA